MKYQIDKSKLPDLLNRLKRKREKQKKHSSVFNIEKLDAQIAALEEKQDKVVSEDGSKL